MRVARDTWLTLRDLGTRAESRDRWSTPWALGARPESPGTAGRPHRTSSTGPGLPGQLVDRRPQDLGRSHLGQLVNTAGPRTRARVVRDSWSTPRDLRHGPEAVGNTGQPREASGTIPSCPGQIVYPTGPRTRDRAAPDTQSKTRFILPESKSPGSAGHATGHRARARDAQDRWLNAGPRFRA